jgi:hypothetical protein
MKKREKQVGKDRKSDRAVASAPPASSPEQASSPPSLRQTKQESSDSCTTGALLSARRSTRVAADKYTHDGDSWQETLAVCEMPATKSGEVKMKIRSYYSNQRTGDRVWDEPPSGASRVLSATEEMRKMAELQLNEMQITFGTALNTPPTEKRRSSLGFLKRHNASPAAINTNTPENTPKFKVKYKPGSILSGIKKKPPKAAQRDDSLDPEIQKAIALSMNESNASATSINTSQQQENGGEQVIRSEVVFGDDELEMVMAMSLSEAEFQQKSNKLSEEEEFQRALEESRRSTSTPAVASLPIKDEFSDLLGSSHSSSTEDSRRKRRSTTDKVVVSANSNESSMDMKIPAKPTKSDSLNQGKSDFAVAGTSRDSRRSDRKVAALSRDSQSRSSRSTANKTGRNDSSLSNLKERAKSTENVSSKNNNTKSSLTDPRVKERPPSQDSCVSKPSTASFSSAGQRYGKSLRPSSNKNLSITRTSSGSSRSSLNAAREQASSAKRVVVNDSTSKAFSPYTDSVELSPAKGISVKEYANARSQRSLFATSNKTKGLTR